MLGRMGSALTCALDNVYVTVLHHQRLLS